MSLSRALSVVSLVVATAVLSGCAQRPIYRNLIGPDVTASEVRFRVTDSDTHLPLAAIPIRVGAGPDKIRTTTDGNGEFSLPVRQTMMDPYTVVDVERPNGVRAYDIVKVGAIGPMTTPMTAPRTSVTTTVSTPDTTTTTTTTTTTSH